MRVKYLLICTTTFLEANYIHGHCIDIHSHIVSQGLHYIPGTNPCTLCICDKGSPKWCKSVLCSPPQNCKSFQVGNSCCEFKCLDDILAGHHDSYKETYDVALRFIASTVTAVLSLSLIFFLYNRLKKNNLIVHHNHQRNDQRNLSSIGYIAGNFGYTQTNLGYLGSGNNELEIRYEETNTNFSLWKPPGNYFPTGEAPPPYEEAMRSAQNDLANQMNTITQNSIINTFSTNYSHDIGASVICRREENNTTSNLPNISSNTHQYVNINVQNYDNRKPNNIKNKEENEVSYENIKVLKSSMAEMNRPTSSGSSKTINNNKIKFNESSSSSSKNIHEPKNTNDYLNKIKQSKAYDVNMRTIIKTDQKRALHRTLPKNLRELLTNAEKAAEIFKMQSTSFETASASTIPNSSKIDNSCSANVDQNIVDLTQKRQKDAKNLITYQSLSQDEEDYRSECENCKSVISTNNVDDEDGVNETMSLQRRPLTESGYEMCYRTSLTLPTKVKKQRSYPNPCNREKWFSSMQQSSSEESD